jgi:hypothetical protein
MFWIPRLKYKPFGKGVLIPFFWPIKSRGGKNTIDIVAKIYAYQRPGSAWKKSLLVINLRANSAGIINSASFISGDVPGIGPGLRLICEPEPFGVIVVCSAVFEVCLSGAHFCFGPGLSERQWDVIGI